MIEECGLRCCCRDYGNLTDVNSDPVSLQYRRLALSHYQAEVFSFSMIQLPALCRLMRLSSKCILILPISRP